MLKPMLYPFAPINAIKENSIQFNFNGQNQIVKNNLILEKLDGTEVYNSIQNTFNYSHVLNANILANGTTYKAKLRVSDINNSWSEFSDYVIFHTLAECILSIISIDNQGKVYNQTVNFQTSYSHPNNEILQSYRYFLYDSNKNLKIAFDEIYSDDASHLTQEITGLINGETYFIEVKTTSVKGQISTTGKVEFLASYSVPKVASGVLAENIKSEGLVKISSSVKQVVLKLYNNNNVEIPNENIQYINNKLDLNNVNCKKLVLSDQKINQNFVMQVWFENIPTNEILLRVYFSNGYFEISYYNNKYHCFRHYYDNNLIAHFVSGDIIISGKTTLFIRNNYNLIDLIAKNISG